MNNPDITHKPASKGDPEAELRRLREEWTDERKESAIPLPLPTRAPQKQAPVSPTQKVPSSSSPSSRPANEGKAARAEGASFDTELVPDVNDYPAGFVGKIFMKFGAVRYIATGWVVGNGAIFTAGHVLYDPTQGWATDVLFEARYNNGASLGTWGALTLVVRTDWINQGSRLNDVAAFSTTSSVAPTTGRLGYMANYSINQGSHIQHGYPGTPVAGYPFDARRMWRTNGAYISDRDWLIEAGGNMTGGASGGPWVLMREGGWYANGLNSFREDDPNRIWSPYFGNEFLSVIQSLKDLGVF